MPKRSSKFPAAQASGLRLRSLANPRPVELTGKAKGRAVYPDPISRHDADILRKVKDRAHVLDSGLFSFCGIKFGWSSVVGFIPLIGDVADAMMAVALLKTCRRVNNRLPLSAEMQMYLNIALAFGVGLIPIVGDMADVVFVKANTRNAIILENHLCGQSVDEEIQGAGPQWWQDPHLIN